jgi:hypothetical protein
MPRLVKRVQGLSGTPFARGFLTELTANAGLIAAAEAYGLVPAELAGYIDRGPSAHMLAAAPAPPDAD